MTACLQFVGDVGTIRTRLVGQHNPSTVINDISWLVNRRGWNFKPAFANAERAAEFR